MARLSLPVALLAGACSSDPAPLAPPSLCDARCDVLWSQAYGEHAPSAGVAVASDARGNVTFAARNGGDADLGAGRPLVVAKLDPSGEALWVHGYEAGLSSLSLLAAEPGGQVAFAGTSRSDALDLGGGPLPAHFKDHEETFLAVLGDAGEHLLSVRLGASEEDAFVDPLALAVAPGGEVFLAVAFTGTLELGGQVLAALPTDLGYDAALVRFDATGAVRWARQLAGLGETSLTAPGALQLLPSGELIVAGSFYGGFDAGLGPWQSAGASDAFVLSLEGESGAPLWGRRLGGLGPDSLRAIAAAPDGSLTLLGDYSGAVDLGYQSLDNGGMGSPFLLSVDASGEVRAAQRLDLGGAHGMALARDVDGTLVVLEVGAHEDRLRLSRRTAEGSLLARRAFAATERLDGAGLALDPLGHVLLTGAFRGDVDFGTGLLEAGPPGATHGQSVFVAKVAL